MSAPHFAPGRQLIVHDRAVLSLAGEIHYFRIDRSDWATHLDLLVDAGADTVATYVPWVVHEDVPRHPGDQPGIDLQGRRRPELDLGAFLDLAADRGLRALVRPGPFVMAELRHEGIPARLVRDHPEIRGVGWDGVPAPTATVDYLAPAFLAEVRRWYAAVGEVLAPRMAGRGGPVVGVQLDNEIGMLAWVSNSPDLTDGALVDLHGWLVDEHGAGLADRYGAPLPDPAVDPQGWARFVRHPSPAASAPLRIDLARFTRDRFGRYVGVLRGLAQDFGFGDVPLYVNVHGTEGGRPASLALGVAQLVDTWRDRPGVTAGTDHYVGTPSWGSLAELHLAHGFLAATLDDRQPLTSLEFEVGTGDYGAGGEDLTDPAAAELKLRMLLAQGVRLINAYLFSGGHNLADRDPDDEVDGAANAADIADCGGTARFGITGERHGHAAPVTPEGEPGISYPPLVRAFSVARVHERWAAQWQPEFDDLAVGFVPDHFATEYRYPGNPAMGTVADDLTRSRGYGPRSTIPLSLAGAGYRWDTVDLTRPVPAGGDRRTLVVGAPEHLAEPVQRRLVEHAAAGGTVVLVGGVPTRDDSGRPCPVLTDVLGMRPEETVFGSPHRFPSIVTDPAGGAGDRPERRVGWLTPLCLHRGRVLWRDAATGRPCAAVVPVGSGRVVVLAAEDAPDPGWWYQLLTGFGLPPGLDSGGAVPGVLRTTTVTPDGDRWLHVINPGPYPARLPLRWQGADLFGGAALDIAARSGLILPLGVRVGVETIDWSEAEIDDLRGEAGAAEITFRASRPLRVSVAGRVLDLPGNGSAGRGSLRVGAGSSKRSASAEAQADTAAAS